MFTPFLRARLVVAALTTLGLVWPTTCHAIDETDGTDRQETNLIKLEVFVRGDSERCDQAVEFLSKLTDGREGIEVVVHDVLEDAEQLRRLWDLSKRGGYEKAGVPTVYCCQRLHCGFDDAESTGPKIADLFTMHVYTRATCPKCRKAKIFLEGLQRRWPGLRIRIYEITGDIGARTRWDSLNQQFRVTPGLPSIHFAGRYTVGYQSDSTTGEEIESLVKKVSGSPESKDRKPAPRTSALDVPATPAALFSVPSERIVALPAADSAARQDSTDDIPLPDELDDVPAPPAGEQVVVDPLASDDLPPSDAERGTADSIEVPLFGQLRAAELGMPAFTFLIGLIDGFNPCAMWVLVFLLSVLVNVKDRRKMLIIAGTFVAVSGIAYFAFMATWLNVFYLVGITRPVQIGLGCLAIFIGAVNVKDFFAFRKGLSLSIPESSKPGIYRRVRQIVAAKYLTAALWGAVVLAVVVNVIELLCTAGLPALYTQILTMQQLPAWANYCYLGLYNVAYMLDDTILLTVVLVTLSRRKLQEREGRWLKLVSGTVILLLGATMIFKPAWLQLSDNPVAAEAETLSMAVGMESGIPGVD